MKMYSSKYLIENLKEEDDLDAVLNNRRLKRKRCKSHTYIIIS
jgi:hypothetical protein